MGRTPAEQGLVVTHGENTFFKGTPAQKKMYEKRANSVSLFFFIPQRENVPLHKRQHAIQGTASVGPGRAPVGRQRVRRCRAQLAARVLALGVPSASRGFRWRRCRRAGSLEPFDSPRGRGMHPRP